MSTRANFLPPSSFVALKRQRFVARAFVKFELGQCLLFGGVCPKFDIGNELLHLFQELRGMIGDAYLGVACPRSFDKCLNQLLICPN